MKIYPIDPQVLLVKTDGSFTVTEVKSDMILIPVFNGQYGTPITISNGNTQLRANL